MHAARSTSSAWRARSDFYLCKRLGRMLVVTGLVTLFTVFVTVVSRLVDELVAEGATV
jgi:hypothetical protein